MPPHPIPAWDASKASPHAVMRAYRFTWGGVWTWRSGLAGSTGDSSKGSPVQLHYGINAPAGTSAPPARLLDDFMGYR